ncbi:hypothetical protein B0H65DRAFT_438573 [Neurospora tetraspora]|uniref:Uncharacterized protein n=1 Tax=Neurospora tetraspora TaxID=94610 RepID=A0AAE0MWB4_9PEZI|nr:hypothetical protein B0H65DRAFT_438573 [Neurospora tetraspora]
MELIRTFNCDLVWRLYISLLADDAVFITLDGVNEVGLARLIRILSSAKRSIAVFYFYLVLLIQIIINILESFKELGLLGIWAGSYCFGGRSIIGYKRRRKEGVRGGLAIWARALVEN